MRTIKTEKINTRVIFLEVTKDSIKNINNINSVVFLNRKKSKDH